MLGIHGLMPAAVQSDKQQLDHAVAQMDRYEKDIDKYIYLNGLRVSCFMIPNLFNHTNY